MLIPECPSFLFLSSEEKEGDYQHKKRSSIDRAFVVDSLLSFGCSFARPDL